MNDTIVAVATAVGVGSISIVRLSGKDALKIAKLLTKRDSLTPRNAHLCRLHDSHNILIDEAIVIYFQAPHSFSGEDCVELQCHGGSAVTQMILQATLDHGARLATGGEFTKRAYINGRIDLSQAESIARLIETKSEEAVKILALQMRGSLSSFVDEIREKLLEILAYSEVCIDYAEEDLPEDIVDSIVLKLSTIKQKLTTTLDASRSRKGLIDGFRVCIIGKPNVGKSSLLNALLNYDRAIVSSLAGTTRDTIEEQLKIGSHLIRIIDTAGIRNSSDEIETIGIERSKNALNSADIVIAIFDASNKLDKEDDEILDLLQEHQDRVATITVLNKCDLEVKADSSKLSSPIQISTKESIEPLIGCIRDILDTKSCSSEALLVSLRQSDAVSKTLNEIESATPFLKSVELELFSFHINEAISAISQITKKFDNDEMLDKMFSSFCLGK